MNNKHQKIWIWLQDNELYKATYDPLDQTVIISSERNEILLKRTGVTPEQLIQLELVFTALGAKRIDGHKEPFTYL
jgi:hypothetical protein